MLIHSQSPATIIAPRSSAGRLYRKCVGSRHKIEETIYWETVCKMSMSRTRKYIWKALSKGRLYRRMMAHSGPLYQSYVTEKRRAHRGVPEATASVTVASGLRRIAPDYKLS